MANLVFLKQINLVPRDTYELASLQASAPIVSIILCSKLKNSVHQGFTGDTWYPMNSKLNVVKSQTAL